jgi:hypothetical protein
MPLPPTERGKGDRQVWLVTNRSRAAEGAGRGRPAPVTPA